MKVKGTGQGAAGLCVIESSVYLMSSSSHKEEEKAACERALVHPSKPVAAGSLLASSLISHFIPVFGWTSAWHTHARTWDDDDITYSQMQNWPVNSLNEHFDSLHSEEHVCKKWIKDVLRPKRDSGRHNATRKTLLLIWNWGWVFTVILQSI